LAFVKDTTKLHSEKILKESWEINEPGRSLKAKTSRFKYILENKIINNDTINRDEVKFLEYFKVAEGNVLKIPYLQQEDSNKINLINDLHQFEGDEPKNNKLKNNTNYDPGNTLSGVRRKTEKKRSLDFDVDTINNTKIAEQSYIQIINNNNNNPYTNTHDCGKILIDENYQKNKSLLRNNSKGNSNLIIQTNEFVENFNFFKSLTTKRIMIEEKNIPKTPLPFPQSNYIKNFLEYVEEDRTKVVKNNMMNYDDLYYKTSRLNLFVLLEY